MYTNGQQKASALADQIWIAEVVILERDQQIEFCEDVVNCGEDTFIEMYAELGNNYKVGKWCYHFFCEKIILKFKTILVFEEDTGHSYIKLS